MEHTSASSAFTQGSSKCTAAGKVRGLLSASRVALARAVPNTALPGLVLASSLLLPSNHLEALDIPAKLKVPIQSLNAFIAPQAGAPIVIVDLDPPAQPPSGLEFGGAQTFFVVDTTEGGHDALGQGFTRDMPHARSHQPSSGFGNLWEEKLVGEWLDFSVEHFAFRQGLMASLSQSAERLTTESLLHSAELAASLAKALESVSLPTPLPGDDGSAPELPVSLPLARERAYGDRRLWELLTLRQTSYAAELGIDVADPLSSSGRPGSEIERSPTADAVLTVHNIPAPEAALGTISSGQFTGSVLEDTLSISSQEQSTAGLDVHLADPAWLGAASERPIEPGAVNAEGWQTAFVPTTEVSARAGHERFDFSADKRPAAPAANTGSLVIPAEALMHHQGEAFVSLASLLDIFKDHFEDRELARFQQSSANASYVSLGFLQKYGISVQVAGNVQPRADEAGLVQANGGASGLSPGASGDLTGAKSGLTKSIELAASTGFDSNPFLAAGSNAEAVSGRFLVSPTVERSGPRSSFRASGRAEHIEYLGKYGSLQNFGADLTAAHRLTERLQFDASALFRSDVLGTNLTNPLVSQDNANPLDPALPGGGDVTLLGQRQRREQFGADAGLTLTPSMRDEFRWSASFRADRFATGGLTDSDFYSQQLRYARQINGTISLGAVVDASIINFTDGVLGDTQTVSPQALVAARIGERFEANASFGVAFSNVELASGDQTNTAVAGNLSLCYRSEVSRLCANGSRQVLPSAIGGARVQTTGGLSYSLRLSERDSLQFGGSYSTASQPLAALGGDFESINAFGRYERTLNERMRLQASVGYIDTSARATLNASSFQALVGISVRFGRDR